MDDLPHSQRFASPEERARPIDVNAGRRVTHTILKNTGAVHHRIDALQVWLPILFPGQLGDIRGNRTALPGAFPRGPRQSHHVVALRTQARRYRGTCLLYTSDA